MAKKVYIGMEDGSNIMIRGGLSLGQLDELVNGSFDDNASETMQGFLRDTHFKWLINKAADMGFMDTPEFAKDSPASIFSVDNVAEAILLRHNEIRNSNLCFWDGGYTEVSMELADAIFERSRRVLGIADAFIPKKGERSAYPALFGFARQAVRDGMGANSYAADHNGSWYKLIQRTHCWNPGKLERSLWAARESYNKKFPSQGNHVSWLVLGRALYVVGVNSPSKTAIVARAIQLGWDRNGHYGNARDFLVYAIMAEQKATEVDGVETYTIKEVANKGAIRIREALVRSYRGWGWEHQFLFIHQIEGSYHYRGNRIDRWAWKEALKAFKSRRKDRMSDEDLEVAVNATDRCHLIWVEDSMDAGNCIPGTEAWMERHGIRGRKFVSLKEVYKVAKREGNPLALNAVKEAVVRLAS